MNNFGRIFRLSIWGESHGQGVGITLDGCPAGIPVTRDDFAADLDRRKAGPKGTTPRKESDMPRFLSGIFNNYTTGAPLTLFFPNENTRSADYSNLVRQPRPGHADYVAHKKFNGYQDYRGGGHFSGRLTLPLTAAGVIAKKIIHPVTPRAQLIEAGGQSHIEQAVEEALAQHDSIGGIVECRTSPMPIGWGEPFFDSLESVIAHLAFAVPAIKGIEFGSGFDCARLTGSQCNDAIVDEAGTTATNHSGGINGGISNGNELIFRVAVKPTSSIATPQQTMNFESGTVDELVIRGRHDTCIALRVPVVIEAITAIALADFHLMSQRNVYNGE